MIAEYDYTVEIGLAPERSALGGRIRFDDASAPYATGSLELRVTDAVMRETDPRRATRPRCLLTIVQTYDGVVTTRTCDLAVRGRNVSHLADRVTVDLASDEALLDDFAPLVDDYQPKRFSRLRDVVVYVLNRAIPGAGARLRPGVNPPALSAGADADALVWDAGASALSFLAPIVQAAGLRLVCDEKRNWTLRPDSYALEGGAPMVKIGVGSNLIDGSDRIDLGDGIWFDAMICEYLWTADGMERRAVDTYALRTPYTYVRKSVKHARFPGTGFAEYAVKRAQARGREVSATAVSQWHVRPELFAQIDLPETVLQMGNIRSVDFSLDTDEMTITARTIDTPDSAYILAPEATRYIDFPPTMQIQNIDWSQI